MFFATALVCGLMSPESFNRPVDDNDCVLFTNKTLFPSEEMCLNEREPLEVLLNNFLYSRGSTVFTIKEFKCVSQTSEI